MLCRVPGLAPLSPCRAGPGRARSPGPGPGSCLQCAGIPQRRDWVQHAQESFLVSPGRRDGPAGHAHTRANTPGVSPPAYTPSACHTHTQHVTPPMLHAYTACYTHIPQDVTHAHTPACHTHTHTSMLHPAMLHAHTYTHSMLHTHVHTPPACHTHSHTHAPQHVTRTHAHTPACHTHTHIHPSMLHTYTHTHLQHVIYTHVHPPLLLPHPHPPTQDVPVASKQGCSPNSQWSRPCCPAPSGPDVEVWPRGGCSCLRMLLIYLQHPLVPIAVKAFFQRTLISARCRGQRKEKISGASLPE